MTQMNPKSMLSLTREGQHEAPVAELDLGARVRELRKSRNWTLEQTAQAAGMARSTLSKIENAQMSPTVEVMKKLAQGLGIGMPQLFTPPQETRANGRMDVTRQADGEVMITPTYEHALLAHQLRQKSMLPYRATIRARSVEEFDGWVRHAGEEFLYVLTGVVRLYTEFYEPVEMRRGDSAYYDATMGHNVVSLSEEDATILWVTTVEG